MTDKPRIEIPTAAEAAMRAHAEATYPYEACGAIFGRGDGESEVWQAVRVEPAPNEHADDQHVRYLVSPSFQADAERRALAAGLDVIGWYHSHPDDLARPSEYDRAHALARYAYLVSSVRSGAATDVNAFTPDAPGGSFGPVDLDLAAAPEAEPESQP